MSIVAVVTVDAPAVALAATCPSRAIAGVPFDCAADLTDAGFLGCEKQSSRAALPINFCHTSGNEYIDDGVGRAIAIKILSRPSAFG
jgi:hypothetical protein